MNRTYSFEPKPDITACEIAEIIKMIGVAIQPHCIDYLSPQTRRHFEQISHGAWFNVAEVPQS